MSEPLPIELQRAYVQAWKKYGPLLEEMRIEEARARSEAEKWEWANSVQMSQFDGWEKPPRLEQECGLIEQQRLFRKLSGR